MTTRGAIVGALVAQLVFAAGLLGRDLGSALPALAWPSARPALDNPVAPGDQTRRFRPGNTPLSPTGPDRPPRPFLNTGDMPDRLQFESEGNDMRVTGRIRPGDAERFAEALEGREGELARVLLNSPGGAVRDALAIGRAIRAAGLDTALSATDICLSACPYILAGGSGRRVDARAQVGVHQHAFDTNTLLPAFLAVEDIQAGQGAVMSYLDEMGVDPLVMQHALVTPPDEIYILVEAELEAYMLATEIIR